jgi:ABC-type transport system involved in cytochrome c biogenesis permease component
MWVCLHSSTRDNSRHPLAEELPATGRQGSYFIPLLATSALFGHERTNGTLRRLLTTPTRPSTFLLGTIAGQADVLPEAGVLLAFAAVFFAVGARRFRYE